MDKPTLEASPAFLAEDCDGGVLTGLGQSEEYKPEDAFGFEREWEGKLGEGDDVAQYTHAGHNHPRPPRKPR